MIYLYHCPECGADKDIMKSVDERSRVERCGCGGILARVYTVPRIIGTRDSFGIGKSFIDKNTGKEIDNWKDWERAGYKQPLEVIKNHVVREQVKEKMKSLKGVAQPKLKPEDLPY